jgi:hypothetical protein
MKFIFVTVIIFSANIWAFNVDHCKISSRSCEFYQCAEAEYRCGSRGYFMSVAEPLCDTAAYEHISKTGKSNKQISSFTKKVRYCLQEKIVKMSSGIKTCSGLKDKALDSHIPCFIENGYCELTFLQKVRVFKNPLGFIKISGFKKMNRLSKALSMGCKYEGK